MPYPRPYLIVLAFLVALASTPAAAATPVTRVFSSGNLNVPIEDAVSAGPGAVIVGFTNVELPITEVGTIVDVNLRLRMVHARDAYPALHGISLDAPGDGGFVILSSVMADFGSGPADCSGTPAVLDDEAATPLVGAVPPFVGPYRPQTSLTDMDGLAMAGMWELTFFDLVPSTSGALYCWELEITYEPPPADLSLRATDTPDPVKTGKRLKYTIIARNNGPGAATGVTVLDTLPAGTTFVSARAAHGSCSRAARKVTCDVGEIAAGASATVTVVVKAPPRPRLLTNTVSITGAEEDPNTANNRAQVRTTVRR